MYEPPVLRADAFDDLRDVILEHWRQLPELPVTPVIGTEEIGARLRRFDSEAGVPATELLAEAASLLREGNLHSAHPRYFGLFNPPALPITVLADALVAAFNPQLAVWAHSPAAYAAERHTLDVLRRRIGLPDGTSAHFTAGGQEANSTALGAALAAAFPEFTEGGLRALDAAPVLYASTHAHHSFHKAARQAGLGGDAVRPVRVDSAHRMDVEALRDAVSRDRRDGLAPFLVVGTAGTTGTGAIDPLAAIGEVCRELDLWFHADAAWGGGALLSPSLAPALAGIDTADSVTWDAHKWLCVPLGAGMCFVRHPLALERLFHVQTGYVPPPGMDDPEPYVSTAQWSRRFIGLKLFLALAWLGADGYRRMVESMAATADDLRALLQEADWSIVNDTPLPLVCTVPEDVAGDEVARIATRVQRRGRAWVSSVALPDGTVAIRACITSYATTHEDLEILVGELEAARREECR